MGRVRTACLAAATLLLAGLAAQATAQAPPNDPPQFSDLLGVPCGGEVPVISGSIFSFRLTATDPQAGQTVHIDHVGTLPLYNATASFSSTDGNPATFDLVTRAAVTFDTTVTFIARDDGNPAAEARCTFSFRIFIRVCPPGNPDPDYCAIRPMFPRVPKVAVSPGHRSVPVAVSCPKRAGDTCAGRAYLMAGRRELGSRSYRRLAGGRRRTVKIRLSRRGLRLVRREGRVMARAMAVERARDTAAVRRDLGLVALVARR